MLRSADCVLASLLDGPLPGSAILRRAEELSGGQVRLATGRLFTTLDRLIAAGFVSLASEKGRACRCYELTAAGRWRVTGGGGADAGTGPPGGQPDDRPADRPGPPPKGARPGPAGEPGPTSLERRTRWLLLAYPAWYRRDRAGELLSTLRQASPRGPGRPSFRDALALAIGGLRVRGWVWLASLLWTAIGAAGAGYGYYATTRPYTGNAFWLTLWDSESYLTSQAAYTGALIWLLLALPLLIAGIARLRDRGFRAIVWAGAWAAGLELMYLAAAWSAYPGALPRVCGRHGCEVKSTFVLPAIVSRGELGLCVAWLVLGVAMTWLLSTPSRGRRQVADGWQGSLVPVARLW